jgi:hypothetical protein
MGFAFNELLAHVNFMLRDGTLQKAPRQGEATRVVAA